MVLCSLIKVYYLDVGLILLLWNKCLFMNYLFQIYCDRWKTKLASVQLRTLFNYNIITTQGVHNIKDYCGTVQHKIYIDI